MYCNLIDQSTVACTKLHGHCKQQIIGQLVPSPLRELTHHEKINKKEREREETNLNVIIKLWNRSQLLNRMVGNILHSLIQGLYSETGFHIGMHHNFVCLSRRHNCRSQVIDLSLSALISWFMKLITGFLNNSNLHPIISTSLIINLHWV